MGIYIHGNIASYSINIACPFTILTSTDTERGGSKDSNDGVDNHSLQNHTPEADSAKEKEEESWKGVSLANEPGRLIHGNMPSSQPVAQG